MRIHCPSCQTPTPADDVNLDTGLAKCRACHAVFRFGEDVPSVRERPVVMQPRSVEVLREGGALVFTHRWFTLAALFLTVFTLFWDGFLVFWYAIALQPGTPLMMKVFPLIHVAAGLGITYYTLCCYVNRTTLTLDRGHLSVRHGPLPWPGNVDMGTSEIRQLYCEEKINRGKNGVTFTYTLHALLRNGTRKKLLSGIDSPEVPLFMEQQLEQWMKLRDEPVRGELAR